MKSFELEIRDLGRMPYAEAFALQKDLQAEVIAQRLNGADPAEKPCGYLLLVEHDPPVITVSRRKTARQHLIATPQQLTQHGVEVAETDRGGDITYHGPGQLVVYPILDLNLLHLRLHGYMRFLEQIVITTLAQFGIEGTRDPEATGVWVREESQTVEKSKSRSETTKAQGPPSRGAPGIHSKIAAMGVRVSRWVSMHGLALNVEPNLDHFSLIVPCGLVGRSVTSMREQLGENCPSFDLVKSAITRQFETEIARQVPKQSTVPENVDT